MGILTEWCENIKGHMFPHIYNFMAFKISILLILLALCGGGSGCGSYDSLLNRSVYEMNRPNDPYQKCASGGIRQCRVNSTQIKSGKRYEQCHCVSW